MRPDADLLWVMAGRAVRIELRDIDPRSEDKRCVSMFVGRRAGGEPKATRRPDTNLGARKRDLDGLVACPQHWARRELGVKNQSARVPRWRRPMGRTSGQQNERQPGPEKTHHHSRTIRLTASVPCTARSRRT